jgi:hypothetical protein
MSLQAFQSCMLRLIADPAFRDRVNADGDAALVDRDLSDIERRRLRAIAADRGLDINRTLHKGFRLGKLRALLPMSCRLLGSRRLSRELSGFWASCPPASFSFIPEALEFCAWLSPRASKVRYLDDVLGYERAMLELERARSDEAPTQVVRFRHDPTRLLGALGAGRRPRAIPTCDCEAVGVRERDGRIRWRIRTAIAAEALPTTEAQSIRADAR